MTGCILFYEITVSVDVRKQKGDDSMRTASDAVQHLNETGCNIYAYREQPGYGISTLRARLKKLGYSENHAGVWMYERDALMETTDADVVTSKRLMVAMDAQNFMYLVYK